MSHIDAQAGLQPSQHQIDKDRRIAELEKELKIQDDANEILTKQLQEKDEKLEKINTVYKNWVAELRTIEGLSHSNQMLQKQFVEKMNELSETQQKLAEAVEVLKHHDTWHRDYYEHGGYKDSDLQIETQKIFFENYELLQSLQQKQV